MSSFRLDNFRAIFVASINIKKKTALNHNYYTRLIVKTWPCVLRRSISFKMCTLSQQISLSLVILILREELWLLFYFIFLKKDGVAATNVPLHQCWPSNNTDPRERTRHFKTRVNVTSAVVSLQSLIYVFVGKKLFDLTKMWFKTRKGKRNAFFRAVYGLKVTKWCIIELRNPSFGRCDRNFVLPPLKHR